MPNMKKLYSEKYSSKMKPEEVAPLIEKCAAERSKYLTAWWCY